MKETQEILGKYLCNDNLGEYRFCEVTQIVLFSECKAINFFTNVECSSKFKKPAPFHFITEVPITISRDKSSAWKLAISRYIISIEELLKLIGDTESTGLWKFNGENVVIDDFFPSDIKYVPESNPTGGQYNVFVPLEYGIYGSNFTGNYYVFELFSRKTVLNKILSSLSIQKIQQEMKKCGLHYHLDKMHACGVSDSEILMIESGKRKNPNWITLCKIAHTLNFHPFELLLQAGYIDDNDINPILRIKGLDRLSVEDIEVVQNVIDAQVAKNAKKLSEKTEFRMYKWHISDVFNIS